MLYNGHIAPSGNSDLCDKFSGNIWVFVDLKYLV